MSLSIIFPYLYPMLFFQFSLNRRITSRLSLLNQLPVVSDRVFSGWAQLD
nr:MAG TPA: hypothetical protein [Caudoviricetes sp.]